MDTTFQHVNSQLQLKYESQPTGSRYTLPKAVKIDLHKWMVKNQVCYGNGFRTDGVLDDFLKSYELFDGKKKIEARNFFIEKIRKHAKNFTYTIKDQGGLDFDEQPGGVCANGHYKEGYEYILEDNYSGTLKRQPPKPVDEILDLLLESLRSHKCAPQKLRYTIRQLEIMATLLEGEEAESRQILTEYNRSVFEYKTTSKSSGKVHFDHWACLESCYC